MQADDLEPDPGQGRHDVRARGSSARRLGTKERIVEAAGDLLYHEGIRAAGVDAIAERAGVAKRTLCKHFRSKDDLIEAYLRKLDESSRRRFDSLLGPTGRPVEQRLANMFVELGQLTSDVRWKGCGFAKAAIELAGLPGHPALRVAQDHRTRFESWIEEALAADEVPGRGRVARRLMILVDGVIIQGIITHQPAMALEAAEMAVELVHAAREGGLDREKTATSVLARAS